MPDREDPLARLLRGCHLLSALSREVLEKGYLEASGAKGVSFAQLNLLKFLDTPQPHAVGDVMRFMGASFPAASKAVGRLKAKGLIRTGRHPGDRRAQVVGLTQEGRSTIARYEKTKFERMRRLLAGTPPRELRRWIEALEAVVAALIREKALDGDLCLQCGAYYSDRCLVRDRRCRVRAPRGPTTSAASLTGGS